VHRQMPPPRFQRVSVAGRLIASAQFNSNAAKWEVSARMSHRPHTAWKKKKARSTVTWPFVRKVDRKQ
jgi:hypothetical protein